MHILGANAQEKPFLDWAYRVGSKVRQKEGTGATN